MRNSKKWFESIPRGKNHPRWNGGKKMNNGYVYLKNPDHPFANCSGYVAEHRLIMENHLGRFLEKREHVHHINGVKSDNRLENLVVLQCTKHLQNHFGKKGVDYNALNNKKWLQKQHIDLEKPLREIARDIGCSHGAVIRAFRRHGISAVKRNDASNFVELNNKKWLADALSVCSTREVARAIRCSQALVVYYQKKHSI